MTPTRRGLLGGAVAAAAAVPTAGQAGALQPLPPVTSHDHPDAALFAACVAAVAVWDRIEATPDGQEDEVWDAMAGDWVDHLETVAALRARTAAGCKAKARILILEMQDSPPGEGDPAGRLAWRLAHDVLLGAMAPSDGR